MVFEGSRTFSSKSAYNWLHDYCPTLDVRGEVANLIFKQFRKTRAPPKVLAFSWQALRKRIPTKLNLFERQILADQQDLVCVFCKVGLESVDLLLLNRNLSNLVWWKVQCWLVVQVPLPVSFEDVYWLHRGVVQKEIR